MDLGTQRSQNIKRQPRLSTKLVLRRRFVCHPRRYASDRAVGLRNNDQLRTTVAILPGNEHGLAAPGMKRVVNPSLDRVLAGSMSLLREGTGTSASAASRFSVRAFQPLVGHGNRDRWPFASDNINAFQPLIGHGNFMNTQLAEA